MYVLSSLGGSGSTYVLRQLRRHNHRWPSLSDYVQTLRDKYRCDLTPMLRTAGLYRHRYRICMRPDNFYSTDGKYDAEYEASNEGLVDQARYIEHWSRLRSAGIRVRANALSTASLAGLVESYVALLRRYESESGSEIVLLCNHWGEIGLLRELGIPTIYLVRDAFNSIISYSKEMRHEEEFTRFGLDDPNSTAWANAFLNGPLSFWVRHVENALADEHGQVLRYDRLADDWHRCAPGLPDITSSFRASRNDVSAKFSGNVIAFIESQTRSLWDAVERLAP